MSTSVGTAVYTDTRVRTAVHLTNAIMGTFEHILAHLGLSPGYLSRHWDSIETGLQTWIAEGSLDDVRLECGDPTDPQAVFSIPLSYEVSGSGDITFVTSQARVTRTLAKLQSVPAGTTYRLVASYSQPHTPVDGWSETTAADTTAMSAYALGGVASGPDASASLKYFSRS